MKCENCGHSIRICGCTWEERIAAQRILERQRRDRLEKEGQPVVVDQQRRVAE